VPHCQESGLICVRVRVCSTATDVPNINLDGTCYVSDTDRAAQTYDCDRVPDSGGVLSGKRRVCCCVVGETIAPTITPTASLTPTASPTTAAPTSVPTPQPTTASCRTPVLGAGNASCTEACASIGRQCTVATLAALNPLVDTVEELGFLMSSLGANCTTYVSEWGYAASHTVYARDSCCVCFQDGDRRAEHPAGRHMLRV
jgi:hypothetical protein